MNKQEQQARLRTLKDIRYIADRWAQGGASPKVTAAFLGFTSSVAISLIAITFTKFGQCPFAWSTSALMAILVSAFAYRRCRYHDWESQAFDTLLNYQPIDIGAYRHMQEQVTKDVALSEVLKIWESAERRAVIGEKPKPYEQAKNQFLERTFND